MGQIMIIIGVICAALAAWLIPHGYYIKTTENKKKQKMSYASSKMQTRISGDSNIVIGRVEGDVTVEKAQDTRIDSINQAKPDLDLLIYKHGKTIFLAQGVASFNFEPEIVNNGTSIAKYIILQIKFPSFLVVHFNKSIWFLFREGDYNILEYKGGINNIVHPSNRMGLMELSVVLPNNFKGAMDIPYSIVCENMNRKMGNLKIEIK